MHHETKRTHMWRRSEYKRDGFQHSDDLTKGGFGAEKKMEPTFYGDNFFSSQKYCDLQKKVITFNQVLIHTFDRKLRCGQGGHRLGASTNEKIEQCFA